MNETGFGRVGPWTEADYFALDETANRIELIDGGLLVTPPGNGPHNDIASELRAALKPAARAAGLRARQERDVRLKPGRIVIPDLIVARGPWVVKTVEAADVVLACEVTSPSNAVNDRVLKMRLYAEARIEWYLLVEPDMQDYESVSLHLLHLEKDHYVEVAGAKHGETLIADRPFPISISTADLLDF